MKLRRPLFWDVNPEEIDLEKHSRFVAERVLTRGNLDDFVALLKYYREEQVKKDVVQIRSMDKLTLNFCSFFFKIPKEDFRCYSNKPFTPKL